MPIAKNNDYDDGDCESDEVPWKQYNREVKDCLQSIQSIYLSYHWSQFNGDAAAKEG